MGCQGMGLQDPTEQDHQELVQEGGIQRASRQEVFDQSRQDCLESQKQGRIQDLGDGRQVRYVCVHADDDEAK